jgi:glycosyltransferase involved in cell wall biosynthesis
VWALPSHTENFGVAVVEALAAGVPTVISPAVNISAEALAADALIVVENAPTELAAALLRLLSDEVERERLAVTGPAFASRYGRSRVGRQLADVYADVCGRERQERVRMVGGGVIG